MTLCFAALIKIIKICSKPKVYNKALCGAVVKTIDEYYGNILEVDDGTVSHLLSCDYNLSPENIVEPAKSISLGKVSKGMMKYVLPLLDIDKLPLGVLALRSMALSCVTEPDAEIGRMIRSTLATATCFDPADFLANIFLYTAVSVENKSGKETIDLVDKSFVDSFEAERESIKLEADTIIEPVELDRTLKGSDFDAVFRKVQSDDDLDLKNRSGLNLYYLDISDSAFDYMALNDYLFDSVGMYVYSRTQMKEFEDKKKVRSMGAKALRLMRNNGKPDEKGTGNELGEMLLFTFLEEGLHAPKLLSKVEISTAASQFSSKSDCVHLLKRKINGEISYQLVFGTSCINGKITNAIDSAFEIIAAIKSGRVRERQMVDSTLFNHTYDAETTERLRQVLVPNKTRQVAPDMAFGVFIGYSLGVVVDDNDAFRAKCMDQMEADIKAVIPYIEKKVVDLKLGMHSYYFYFLPFNDAEADKKQIMDMLLLGGGD